jgi:hypothetical protein
MTDYLVGTDIGTGGTTILSILLLSLNQAGLNTTLSGTGML